MAKKVKIAPFWGKVGILHLSYLFNKFGEHFFEGCEGVKWELGLAYF